VSVSVSVVRRVYMTKFETVVSSPESIRQAKPGVRMQAQSFHTPHTQSSGHHMSPTQLVNTVEHVWIEHMRQYTAAHGCAHARLTQLAILLCVNRMPSALNTCGNALHMAAHT
jgi:hypothetical protein